MDEPLQLDSMGFFDFIARSELVVLFLSVHPAHRFNHLLCERFAEEKGTEVAFGQLHLLELFASATPALSFLRGEIIECGAPVPLAVPPGYYLFQHGHMLAWDSGLPSTVDAKRIIRGSMLGAVFSLFARNLSFVGMALRHVAEDAAAARVASRFRRAAVAHRESPRRASERTETATDDLMSAYRVLQVDPSASNEQVHRAWRALQRKFHPDRAANDPEEFSRLSRRCVEINRARETIQNYRRKTHQRATAS